MKVRNDELSFLTDEEWSVIRKQNRFESRSGSISFNDPNELGEIDPGISCVYQHKQDRLVTFDGREYKWHRIQRLFRSLTRFTKSYLMGVFLAIRSLPGGKRSK